MRSRDLSTRHLAIRLRIRSAPLTVASPRAALPRFRGVAAAPRLTSRMVMHAPNLVLVSVGNTRTRLAAARVIAGLPGVGLAGRGLPAGGGEFPGGGEIQPSRVLANTDLDAVLSAL